MLYELIFYLKLDLKISSQQGIHFLIFKGFKPIILDESYSSSFNNPFISGSAIYFFDFTLLMKIISFKNKYLMILYL